MRRSEILMCAIVLAGCSPGTEGIGVVASAGSSSATGDDGSTTASTTTASTMPADESGEGDATDDPDSGGLLPKMDMGAPDLPDEGVCRERTFCDPEAVSTIALVGTTPLGDVELDYVGFGVMVCECPANEVDTGSLQLVWSSAPLEVPEWYEPAAGVDVLSVQYDSVRHERDGEDVTATAILEFTSAPRGPIVPDATTRVTGTIMIEDDGWALQGEFDAPLCDGVDFPVPCE